MTSSTTTPQELHFGIVDRYARLTGLDAEAAERELEATIEPLIATSEGQLELLDRRTLWVEAEARATRQDDGWHVTVGISENTGVTCSDGNWITRPPSYTDVLATVTQRDLEMLAVEAVAARIGNEAEGGRF